PVADTVGDERFLRGVTGLLAVDVVTNQQIGTESHAFPTDKHQNKVVGQDEGEHGKHEQVEESEEAIETGIAVHVAHGKDMNQKTNEGDEERVCAAKPVHAQGKIGVKSADRQPGPDVV